ncbi:MAG: phosphocholine cytidylyltransferase family protein [Alsobacter sp.]
MSAMRAVILAAGFGSRLKPLTETAPKCLTQLAGESLLARQLRTLRTAGIDDISIVAGHLQDRIDLPGLKKILNPHYERTNMVSSLFCARHLLDGSRDLVICYGDIVFQRSVLETLLATDAPVAVAVDRGWYDLWKLRMEDPLTDAETLKVDGEGRLVELGRKPRSLEDIQGQYIGLIKVAAESQSAIVGVYDGLAPAGPYEGRDKSNMFMTSFIQIIIDRGIPVMPAFFNRGWLEIDSMTDYESYNALARTGALSKFYDDRL